MRGVDVLVGALYVVCGAGPRVLGWGWGRVLLVGGGGRKLWWGLGVLVFVGYFGGLWKGVVFWWGVLGGGLGLEGVLA